MQLAAAARSDAPLATSRRPEAQGDAPRAPLGPRAPARLRLSRFGRSSARALQRASPSAPRTLEKPQPVLVLMGHLPWPFFKELHNSLDQLLWSELRCISVDWVPPGILVYNLTLQRARATVLRALSEHTSGYRVHTDRSRRVLRFAWSAARERRRRRRRMCGTPGRRHRFRQRRLGQRLARNRRREGRRPQSPQGPVRMCTGSHSPSSARENTSRRSEQGQGRAAAY